MSYNSKKDWTYISNGITETGNIFLNECKNVFKDSGVLLILIIAGLTYPILYNFVYLNENIPDTAVAVIDRSDSYESHRFIRELDATREVKVIRVPDMLEARKLFVNRDVHAILIFPGDYSAKIAARDQTTISLYVNMSCFMVYKSVALAVNMVMLDEGKAIQLQRYNTLGMTDEQSKQMVKALPYEETMLYNPGNGFSSFFVPAILMIIIHQLLFLGIGMMAGTEREENINMKLFSKYLGQRGIYRVVIGKACAYFFIYSFVASYIALLVPRMFNIPHIGNVWEIYSLLFPFLLATIFFSITASIFIKNRETGLVSFLFFSVILVFLSGCTWPETHFPLFWKYFAYIFPSTFGVRGYIKLNSMGATLSQIRFEYIALWIQVFIYFILACVVTRVKLLNEKRRKERIEKGDNLLR